ncbi:hypothetical protein R0K05_24140, partial [Planococcus sp. SIMBA_160]
MKEVSETEVKEKLEESREMFQISEDSSSDSIARKPTDEQLQWSCKIAVAAEKMLKECDLAALAYYDHGSPGFYLA